MSTLDRIIDARERLAEAHHVAEFLNESLRDLEATLTVDEVARHIPAPRSFTARIREALDIDPEGENPTAVCAPVRCARPREDGRELRLIATPWESEVGIVVLNKLVDVRRARTPSIVLLPYPHAAAQLAGAWDPDAEHLEELIRTHALRGVILGIQHDERQGHALAYDDEPVLLTLTDVLANRHTLDSRQRDARAVNWSELPCATLLERSY